ncbi:MAG: hypothetical protein AAF544_06335 [Bacteroidota bacterium]
MHRIQTYISILILCLSWQACGPSAEVENDRPAEVQNEDTTTQHTTDQVADIENDSPLSFSFTNGITGIDPSNLVASLTALYGENVEPDSLYFPDGVVVAGYRVFADTPNELEVLEPESSTGYDEVMSVIRSAGNWKSAEGIYVGMPLEELVRINGAPVNFSGFAWDYGGFISDFNQGNILDAGLRLDIVYDEEESMDLPIDIMGEVQLNSDDPILKDVPIVVSEMSITNTTNPVKIGTFLAGHHFDQIRPGDTPENLRSYYGDAVKEVQIHLGEGEFESGYEVFSGSPQQVSISLNESGTVAAVSFESEDAEYYEPVVYQLLPGLDLAGLQAINGAPVTFAGFGWDYAGTVIDFNGGELEGYEVVLKPIDENNTELIGDKLFQSDEVTPELLLQFKVAKVTVLLGSE